MAVQSPETLVIGARGGVGRHVVSGLLAAGAPVRASVRQRSSGDFPAGVRVVEADLTDTDSLKRVLEGVRSVFLYTPLGGTGPFVSAALAGSLERIVVLSSGSVLLPSAAGNAIAEEHREMEHDFTSAGLPLVPIRPLVLASNALNWVYSIKMRDVVRLVHPESITAPVHEKDIAAVAVAALTGDDRPVVSEMLTGPEFLSHRAQVRTLARVLGRELTIEELSEAQARDVFGGSSDPGTVDAVLWFMREALTPGASPMTGTVSTVLGRPPLPFSTWAQDNASAFT